MFEICLFPKCNKYRSKPHIYKPKHTLINYIVHCDLTMLVDNYVKPILQLNLTTLMNNYVKLVINVTQNKR